MIKRVYKTKLKVNSKKISEGLKQRAGIFRFVFNRAIDYQWNKMVYSTSSYEGQTSTLPFLQECLKIEKETKDYSFLASVDLSVQRKALSCSNKSFLRWHRLRMCPHHIVPLIPKYIARKTEGMRFSTFDVKIFYDHIKLPKLGKIGLYEKGYLPQGKKPSNISFSHDGKDWWISLEFETSEKEPLPDLKGSLVIDFNKDGSLTTSEGTFESVSAQSSFVRASKRYKKLAKKLGRQKRANSSLEGSGKVIIRTSRNMVKTRKALLRASNKIERIKSDYFRKVTNELAKTKPEEVHLISKEIIRKEKNNYLSRTARATGVRKFFNILLKKLQLQGASVERHETSSEFSEFLGSRICGEVSEYSPPQKDISVKQELLLTSGEQKNTKWGNRKPPIADKLVN